MQGERAIPDNTIMWKVCVSLSVRGRIHYWSVRGAALLLPLITTGDPHASVVVHPTDEYCYIAPLSVAAYGILLLG